MVFTSVYVTEAAGNGFQQCLGICHIVVTVERTLRSHITPVSYTHLDVYKRQAIPHSQAESERVADNLTGHVPASGHAGRFPDFRSHRRPVRT